MLTLFNGGAEQFCDGISRRSFLRAGGLALGGLALADKFAVVRSATWQEPDHQRIEIFTGFPKKERRPSFGSYVSRLVKGSNGTLPKFISLKGDDGEIAEAEQPLWVGAQHRAFVPNNQGLKSLEVTKQVDISRLKNRKELLSLLDTPA